MAATFDRELLLTVSDTISDELRAQNNDDIAKRVYEYHHGISCWSPVVNIMRYPLGRLENLPIRSAPTHKAPPTRAAPCSFRTRGIM